MNNDPNLTERASDLSQQPLVPQTNESVKSEYHPPNSAITDDALKIEEERLKAYAHLLDSAIRLPGGFRIGLDGIVGLIPGVGDLLGAGLSGYFIYAASRLDIPRSVITRMILNSAIETIIGMVPLLGDAFDFVFRANDRNARLLRSALEARDVERTTRLKGH